MSTPLSWANDKKPCPCWVTVCNHGGHCCMVGIPDDYKYGQPIPCGHITDGMDIYDAACRAGKVAAS